MKYMGSKRRLVKELLPIILKERVDDSVWYVEPFAGGMNMVEHVSGNVIASDNNRYLIAMWQALLDGWRPKEYYDKNYYDLVKNNIDLYPAHLVGWIGFNCSYRGKFFNGFAGLAKTRDGGVRNYQSEAIRNVMKQLPKLKGVVLRHSEYYELGIPRHSIIYCDPPYQGTTKYHNEFDYDRFWEWVREMSRAGHKVYVSEYNAPDDFECIWEKELKSSLSNNGSSGGFKKSTEKLFIYKPQ